MMKLRSHSEVSAESMQIQRVRLGLVFLLACEHLFVAFRSAKERC